MKTRLLTLAIASALLANAASVAALTPSPETIPPECMKVGTRSEGWYDYDGILLEYAQCANAEAECKATGSRSEGWYDSKSGDLITYASCSGNAVFYDVRVSHEYFEPIMNLYDRGIVSGYADGSYKPKRVINRAEFTKIVIGAKYSKEEIGQCLMVSTFLYPGVFKDANGDEWFVPYLCMASTRSIINGYPDGTFRSADYINFAEAAKILALTFDTPTPKPVAGTVWYKPYIDGLKLSNALPASYTGPDKLVSRGEMAFMIHALLSLNTDETPIPTDQPVVGEGCKVGGCSGTICQNTEDEDVMTTCEWRQEYACYEHATCEKQSDGECGWTQTEYLNSCLNAAE